MLIEANTVVFSGITCVARPISSEFNIQHSKGPYVGGCVKTCCGLVLRKGTFTVYFFQ